MEKKMWSKPEVSVVEFAANEYCTSSCRNDGAVNYLFGCDAAYENATSYAIAFDNNSSSVDGKPYFHYDEKGSWAAYYYMKDAEESYNKTGQIRFTSTFESEYDQLLQYTDFDPCDETHVSSSLSSFFGGWLIPNLEGIWDFTKAQAITIWTGEENNNIHATLTLGVENLDVARS